MSITWNGVSSDTIGVVVERIPNRYVPTRRFSPQQVAGRNGNILLVDKSFPNVEQEYEVYLSAEAQGLPSVARACAEWLMGPDGYCRLEDSYDTTVYREAFLMGGYDLENILNKFGRCTITFSCKPQKYLLTGDTPIEIPDGTTTTYTGDVVQFDGVTGASITSLSTTITPTQDLHGYASPWPAGGGKNLFQTTATSKTESGVTWTVNEDGSITATGTATGATTILAGAASVDASMGNVAISLDGISGETNISINYVRLYDANGNQLSTIIPGGLSYIQAVFDLSQYADAAEIRVSLKRNNNVATNGTVHIQVEKGTSYTDWTPYSNICPISGRTGLSVYVGPTQDQQDATTYAVDWTTEAGTVYSGTVDPVTGQLTVTHESVSIDDLLFSYDSTNKYFKTEIEDRKVGNFTFFGSSALAISPTSIFGQMPNWSFVGGSSNKNVYIKCFDYTDPTAFKNALSGQTIVYELATPLTYQLTAQEIEVLVGENNVWTSSGPVSVTVVTPLGGIVTNPTPFEARPMLEVSGVGEITINGKSIQILESVSDFQIDCEAMEAEDNSKIYCMDFPELSGGENEIVGDGSITALTVTPRWWTL